MVLNAVHDDGEGGPVPIPAEAVQLWKKLSAQFMVLAKVVVVDGAGVDQLALPGICD